MLASVYTQVGPSRPLGRLHGDALDRTWALREDTVFVHICPVTQDSGWPGVLPWRRGLQSSWRRLRALVHSRAPGTPDPSGPTRGGISPLETIQARLQLAEAGAHGVGATASSPDFQNQRAPPTPRGQQAERRTLTCCPQRHCGDNHLLGVHSQCVNRSPETSLWTLPRPHPSSHPIQALPGTLPALLPHLRGPARPLKHQ